MAPVFLDTNIILRHILGDHPEHSAQATAYLARIEQGDLRAYISELVIFETVFTLQHSYHRPKTQIQAALLPLLELPGIVLPGKRHFRTVFDLYVTKNLPFADAYHVVFMQRRKLDTIVTFDRDFDKIPGITRVEP